MSSFSSKNKKEKEFPGKLTDTLEYTRLLEKGKEFIYDDDRKEEARTHFEDMVLQFPKIAGPYLFLGITYRNLDLYSESEQTLRKALELNKEDGYIWCELGCTLSMQSRFSEAEEAFRRALQLDEDSILSFIGLGDILLRTERYKEARDLLRRGIEIEPDNYWLWMDLGRAYFEIEHYNKALRAFNRAADCIDERSAPYRGIAMVFQARNDLNSAKRYYEIAIATESDDLFAKRGLAEILVEQGAFDEAEEILATLIELDEADCQAWKLLGEVYLQTERIGQAEEAFKEALEECCNLEIAHRGLLKIYELTDRVDEAEEKREKLKKMVDGEPMTDELMDEIIQSIDPSIQSIIAEFHSLGLMTASCCSGLPEDHPDRESQNPYVYFWADYEGAHHHLFTIANMAGWTAEYGVNGWGVEVSVSHSEPEDIQTAWARLIQMARLVMPHLEVYIQVMQDIAWEESSSSDNT